MPSARIELPINGPTYLARGRAANIQDCINWYPETDPTATSQLVLYPTPGSKTVTQSGPALSNPLRGLVTDPIEADEKMWAVAGEKLYTLTPAGPLFDIGYVEAGYWDFGYTNADAVPGGNSLEQVSISEIGTMTGFPTDTPVHILPNADWVFVMAAGEGEAWVWNKNTTTLSKVTDVDYPYNQTPQLKLNTATYNGGYFIVSVRDSEVFYVSDLNDPTSWDSLAFASVEQHPDALVRAVSNKKELWMLGKNSVEVWQNVGALTQPFEPLLNVFFDIGCLAPLSTATIDDSLLFLGRDPTGWGKVFQFQGFQAKVVSNTAIESLINKRLATFELDTNVTTFGENIVAYAYKDRGHSFYVLTIPSALTSTSQGDSMKGLTLVYDLNSDSWHQRASTFTDATDGTVKGRHFSGESFAMSRYKHYAGHYIGNNLYKLDAEEFIDFAVRDNDGVITSSTPIDRQRTAPYISDNRARTFWHFVEVDTQQGLINPVNVGVDSTLTLRFSNDDGQTFTSGITRTIGGTGVTRRLKFNRLGSSRERVYRISTSSPSEVVVLGSYAEITAGDT